MNNKYYENLYYKFFFGLLCYSTSPVSRIIFLDFKAQVCLPKHCEGPGYHVTYRLAHIKDITNFYTKTYKGMKINIRPLSGTKLAIWHAGGRRQYRYIVGYRADYYFLSCSPLLFLIYSVFFPSIPALVVMRRMSA